MAPAAATSTWATPALTPTMASGRFAKSSPTAPCIRRMSTR